MTLIDEIVVMDIPVKFYEGINFDEAIKHSKDGLNGYIIFFINKWEDEVHLYNRDNKIDSIINNSEFREFKSEDIENKYVSIYQVDGVGVEEMYKTIRKKIENKNFPNQPWEPVGGFDKGAWKITNNKSGN
jgi:hypothetical protein